ncbi:hypothetical protein Tco_0371666 [Tanacetum coccineum]
MEEIKNFQQEPDESLLCAWERLKELLMKCPQHYLTDMQEVILFYNGLDVPTRQIFDSNGVIPSKTVADAKIAIQEMAEYSQKWHNGTSSRTRSTETFDGLAAIQAQLNNLGREIKKVNEKVYTAQKKLTEELQNHKEEMDLETGQTTTTNGNSFKPAAQTTTNVDGTSTALIPDDFKDPSKQERTIVEIDQDPGISLVQHDVEIQGRYEHDIEFEIDFNVAKKVSTTKKDVSTVEPVSTVGAIVTTDSVAVSTASPTRYTRVSTTDDITMAKTLVYIRKSAAKHKEKEWGDIQARVEVDKELVQRLQIDEREKYTEVEQERMLAELINQRKRYFAAQRAKERRKNPPTQAQQRTYMSNYIKHMGSHTLQQLRGYSFDKINTLFEITMRRVNTFVLIESKVDRAVPELAAESSKSSELAKEPRDKEADELSQEELQQMMIIVLEQWMNVEALQTKNHTKVHHFFVDMLKAFDKDDIVMLWSLVKEKFNSTELVDDKEREIWVELKRLFEPDTDDELWKLQKYIHDLTWKLYDSCEVHHVSTKKEIDINMLVEKEYPLSRGTLTLMLVAKLLVERDNELSRELLMKIFMQDERPRR